MNTFYTHSQLTRRSTAQLIAIYNRLFNTNIWDDMFNPYEARQEIILALWVEMRAQEIVAQFTDEDRSVEPYKAMKIVVSADGMAILWNVGTQVINRSFTDAQMRLVRELRTCGETYEQIAEMVGVSKKNVFDILSGRHALTPNRWNTNTDAPNQIKPRRQSTQNFKAATQKVIHHLIAATDRPLNDFWQSLGL
jgi:hypothetical protein